MTNGSWQEVTNTDTLINFVKANRNLPVELELRKSYLNPETYTTVVTPKYDEKLQRAIIGVQLVKFVSIDYSQSLGEKIFAGVLHAYNLTDYNIRTQSHIFGEAIKQKDASIATDAMGGPVAIGGIVNDTIKESGSLVIRNLVNLMALISLSLAFMNILPIPALDGGRIFLLIPEMITGRKVPHKIENYINIAGFIVLIGLSILVTIKDVIRLAH